MIKINLLPPEHRRKEHIKISLPDMPIGKILAGLFAVFFVAQVFFSGYAVYEHVRVAKVADEIARLTEENRSIAKQKTDIAALNNRLKEIDSLTARRFFWCNLLNSVSDSTTKGVWLTSLSLESQDIAAPPPPKSSSKAPPPKPKKAYFLRLEGSVVGEGQETAYIGKFIKELKDNPDLGKLFDDVKLSTINQKKIRDVDVYDFVLLCVFKPEKI